MPSPFPGMDPYIERPEIWPDFHDSLVTYLSSALQPRLRPRYVALQQHRLGLVESNNLLGPEVEEIREPFIHIIEHAADNRIVAAIEVLSPDNKVGAGREAYGLKREELRESGTQLVEIDLLRGGDPIAYLADDHLDSMRPWHYLVNVIRCKPTRQAVYPIPLTRRLPVIAIPLLAGDPDITLDLQAVFTRCWDEGPYPDLLHYEGPPPGPLTPDEVTWCEGVLRTAGYRPRSDEAIP